MAKKKATPKEEIQNKDLPNKYHTISLGEYRALRGIKETIIAGFKVWLGQATARTLQKWDEALEQYMKS